MTRGIDQYMDFFLREKGETVAINGANEIALVLDATDKIKSIDEKMIRSAVPIHTGDSVDFHGERYIIVSQIDQNAYSYRGRMRKCNDQISFNWKGNVKWFDAFVDGQAFSIDEGRIISMAEGKIQVILQDNSDTRDITLNQRFYQANQAFKVEGLDRTQSGLLTLSCKLDSKSMSDDVEGNIADRWSFEVAHSYTITIENGTEALVLINDIFELSCAVTDNGNIVAYPAITFTSSDSSVVSVDNRGRLMGITLGVATITAKLTYHPSVLATMQIEVVEQLGHQYTFYISEDSTIYLNQNKSYVCSVYDNGSEVYDQSVVWSIRNQNNTTPIMATITTQTGNSVTIKAGSQSTYTNKYIVLAAALSSDQTISAEKVIQIKSLI